MSKGLRRLYLDFYPAIVHPETGKPTRREFLKLFIYDKPKGESEREHNKETKIQASSICSSRQLDIQAKKYGFLNRSKGAVDFILYFKELAERRKTSKGNYDNWLSTFNYFNRFTKGNCPVENLNERFCNDFREYLLNAEVVSRTKKKVKLSQNSAHSYFNKFRAAVNQAYEERLIDENPIKRVKGIKQADTERPFLTLEELKTLAKTECDPPVLKRVALFSALTGLRWGDIVTLTWDQVHESADGPYIQFRQKKTKGAEVLPIPDQAVELIGERQDGQLLFPNLEYSGWISQKLKIWLITAGIKKPITFHCFRHTYAIIQLTNGTDIYTVSKMLGHKNLKTTQIYAKVVDQKKRDATNKIIIDL